MSAINDNLHRERLKLQYYTMESFVYRVSDHLPKRIYTRTHYGNRPILSVEDGRKCIIEKVADGSPFMVGRYGTSEGRALAEYYQKKYGIRKSYMDRTRDFLCCNAVFFPNNQNEIDRWAEMLSDLSSECDILGVMNFYCEGYIVEKLCPNAILMPNGGIGSGKYGYTHCLEGKKILVIHPMDKTIENQYNNHRKEIFPETNALPEFELKTLRAINTQADERDWRFSNWFEALDYMTEEVEKINFDIALVGCGAYGFPLAARIKRMGKSAIHMGGAVQYLFGIKNARADQNAYLKSLYNDAWVYPDESERPKGSEKVEGGCYWKPIS